MIALTSGEASVDPPFLRWRIEPDDRSVFDALRAGSTPVAVEGVSVMLGGLCASTSSECLPSTSSVGSASGFVVLISYGRGTSRDAR